MAPNAPGRAPEPDPPKGIRAWPRLAQGAAGLSVVCALLAVVLAALTLRAAPVEAVVTGLLEVTPDEGLFDDLRVYDSALETVEPLEMAALVRLTEGANSGQILVARGVPAEGAQVGDIGVVWPVSAQDATWGTTPTITSFLGPVVLGVGALLLALGAGFSVERNKSIKERNR